MKYIIFKGNGFLHPVIFADHTSHAQIQIRGAYPISAGFIRFSTYGFPECFGESESLKLQSRGKEDEDIIRKMQLGCNCNSFMLLK